MSNHFIGVDAGGTTTRALLATEAGEVVGGGRSAGANSWSSGTSVAGAITTAMRAAISESGPTSVAGGAIAVAGGGAHSPEIAAEIDEG
ncbi:MAG: ATPase, partial [Chloroflexota bacterium]|nr:ATPase [Chloroflexota bacterium]